MTQTTEKKLQIKELSDTELRELNRLLWEVSWGGRDFLREVNLALSSRFAIQEMDRDYATVMTRAHESLYDLLDLLSQITD